MTIAFSLVGGLGLFLYGMKLMSEGLEKSAGAKMRGILEFFTKNRFVACRYIIYGSGSVIKCDNSNGCEFCEFRTYDTFTGDRSNPWRKYRYYSDIAAYCVQSFGSCSFICHDRCGHGNVLQEKRSEKSRGSCTGIWYLIYGIKRNVLCHVHIERIPVYCRSFRFS